LKSAKKLGHDIPVITYANFPLPPFETAAEIQVMAKLGCDLVGGSTVPEIITSHLLGLNHVGFGCCSNPATGI